MYLGIDLGTSSVKSVLLDEDQNVIGSSSCEQTVSRPYERWSEQDPAGWIEGVEKTFADLRERFGKQFAAVKGIGLSGQQHGAVLLDERDEVIRPCILWNDTRAWRQAAELDTDRSRELYGNIVFPGFTSPKIRWVAEEEPDNFSRIAKVLLPKDYVNFWLTGEHVAEMSDASGTGWLNVKERDWSDELLGLSGLTLAHMPRLVEGSAAAGQLRTDLAERFGFSASVVVAGGAGDNAASACGMGIVAPGSAFVSLGTSGVLFAANEGYKPHAESAVHTFCHAIPDTWHQMGVILAATDALNWLGDIVNCKPSDLVQDLDPADAEPVDVIFLPYLGGERTPHNNADARGAFLNLGHSTDIRRMTRAVLQGVSFAFRDNQHALARAGTTVQDAYVVGGGSRSAYWVQLLASILDMPLKLGVDGDFGAGLGAARLAMMACSGAAADEVCDPPAVASVVEPKVDLREAFDVEHARYRAAYGAVQKVIEG